MKSGTEFNVVVYSEVHFGGVKALWREAPLDLTAWRAPEISIPAKIAVQRDLFLVAVRADLVIGTTMAGYDGHRGWLYSVAVLPAYRRAGVGTALIREAEKRLLALGCHKINLQIVLANYSVAALPEARLRGRRAHLDEQTHRDVCEGRCAMTPTIVLRENPDPQIRAALMGLMMTYNESRTGPSGFALLALTLDDPQTGQWIGGLWGRTVYDWLFVELLFVPEPLRGHGIGRTLLQKAEDEALVRGCIGVCLDTFDFNAPGFYRKLGYEEFAALESPRRGFSRHFFRKHIGAPVQPSRLSS